MRLKLASLYVLSYLILILLLAILNSSIYINRHNSFDTIALDYLVVGISVMIVFGRIMNGFLVRLLIRYIEKEADANAQTAYFESINDLFQTIKSQRHDFNNHVQVLYGMITENLIDSAKQYIADVFKETKEINEIVVVDRPELAALFRAKHSRAALNNIGLNISVNCKLSMLNVKPHDLVRIFGNLIDNAIEATTLIEGPKREIYLNINKRDVRVYIKIINPGEMLQEKEYLFVPGASSKSGHSGLGLYVVKKIVESYNGSIDIESSNGQVQFIVSIPCS